jgi:hypothetical protein
MTALRVDFGSTATVRMHMTHQTGQSILSTLDSRYLRALTWASVVVFLCLLGSFWVWIPSWRYPNRLFGLLVLLPFLLPYGFIPVRLNSRRVQSGLTLAIAMGCALFVPGVYLICFVFKWEKNWWILGNLVVALLMQPVLVVIAAKTFITMPHPPKWSIKLLGTLTYGAVLFGLFLMVYSPIPRQLSENEAAAQSYLFDRAIAVAIDLKCEVPVVDLPKEADGYFFEYSGVSPSITTEGCPGFKDKSFVITARPIVYGRTGIRSFFVDKNLAVHATSENRPANPGDPIVRTMQDFHHRPA